MYRQVVSVTAKNRKEAVINLCLALKAVLGCGQRSTEISTRICVPDDNGDIEDSELLGFFNEEES